MNQKSFNTYAGTIFFIVAIVHLWRAINQLPLVLGSTHIPVWASWVAVIIAGILSYQGLRKHR